MTLIVLAIAWLLGLVAADLLQPAAAALLGLAGAGGLLAALGGKAPRLRLAGLALACAALGGLRLAASQAPSTPQSIQRLNDRGELTVEGLVIDDPRRSADGQRVTLAAERAWVGGRPAQASGLVLATLPTYPERHYGDRLRLSGQLSTPREAERPGQFDYRQYLARKRIFSLMDVKSARLVAESQGGTLWSGLLALRDRARRVLLHELPEPQASLAVGILLGLQSSIPDNVSADFSTTGTSHILVISGWNISIIAAALYRLAEALRLDKRRAFWAILATIWLYTLFKGWTQSNKSDHVCGKVGGTMFITRSHIIVCYIRRRLR